MAEEKKITNFNNLTLEDFNKPLIEILDDYFRQRHKDTPSFLAALYRAKPEKGPILKMYLEFDVNKNAFKIDINALFFKGEIWEKIE